VAEPTRPVRQWSVAGWRLALLAGRLG
jgi:hypothetical protein